MFGKIKKICLYLWDFPKAIKYGFIQIPWVNMDYIKYLFLLDYARDYKLERYVSIPYHRLRIKVEKISALFPKWTVPIFFIFFFIPYNIYLNLWWHNHTIYLPYLDEYETINTFYLRRYSFRKNFFYYFKAPF